MDTLLDKEFTNIVGIDEHTALILNGKDNSFEIEGIGNVTVINHKEEKKFEKGKIYDLNDLKNLLSLSKNNIYNNEKSEIKLDDISELNEQIAKLKLQIQNEKNYSETAINY